MQNKGALKFLIVVLALACAYQLSFTFVTRNVEKKAERYAQGFEIEEREARTQLYLDSIKATPVYNLGFIKFTYKEAKEKEINLGLDLKGGMNVMLEISVRDIVEALSNHNQDPIFKQALAEASAEQKNSSDDYIAIFARAYSRLSNDAPLAYIFNTPELKDKITPQSDNAQVIKALREESESAISNSFNVIRNRIDRFGVTQPNIQKMENSGRILVELPGVKEPERVRKLLQGTASLEFWATYTAPELIALLSDANSATVEVVQAEEIVTEEGAVVETGELESLVSQAAGETPAAPSSQITSLFSKLTPAVDPMSGQPLFRASSNAVIGRAMQRDMADVEAYFNLPQVKSLMPRELKLMWSAKPDETEMFYELYAIKADTRDGRAPLDGSAVTDAREEYAQRGAGAHVSMTMNAAGARTWARLTADNINRPIAIVLDDHVYSAPNVQNEITGGQSQITGNFTIQEAKDLSNVLKSGKLPAPARIIQDTVVGPTLGLESIKAGMMSFLLAFVLVLIYMVVFYSQAGWVANIALVSNVVLLFGILASFGAALTLPGLAGIVVTMGFAVDANVLIYERVKEELRAGKGLSLALKDGYKNAMSAIIDGNVTTFITGLVLFFFGTGPVQGFATTLMIGIITSLFTAIFISRLIFESRLAKGKNIKFSTKFTENFLRNLKIDFVGLRKYTYIFGLITVIVATGALITRIANDTLPYGVDFSGGRVFVVRFDQSITSEAVREKIDEAFSSGSEIKQYGAADRNQMRIITQYNHNDMSEEATQEINEMLYQALLPMFAQPLTQDEFLTTTTSAYGVISSDKVGPTVANDLKRNAVVAVVIALLAIGAYIAIRFKKWQWATGAVVSLALEVIMCMGLVALLPGLVPFSLEVDQSFIAAVLTVLAYSINDTVIIFDRIREYNRLYPKRTFRQNINGGINSTLSRTFNTAGTTIVTLLAIFIFGGEVIRGFIFIMLFGVILATFSSVFVATPIAYDIIRWQGRRNKADKSGKPAEKSAAKPVKA